MTRDQVDQDVIDTIKEYGWIDIAVFPTMESQGPPFNYTVGLTAMDHPELVVMGLNNQQGHGILCAAVKLIEGGTTFQADHYAERVLTRMPVAFAEVTDTHHPQFPLSMANRMYGIVHALQLIWPDAKGKFPWQKGFDERHRADQVPLGKWGGTT